MLEDGAPMAIFTVYRRRLGLDEVDLI